MGGDDLRMSVGLGMTRDEWLDLKSKVDDSFWVMRVIGTNFVAPSAVRHIHRVWLIDCHI